MISEISWCQGAVPDAWQLVQTKQSTKLSNVVVYVIEVHLILQKQSLSWKPHAFVVLFSIRTLKIMEIWSVRLYPNACPTLPQTCPTLPQHLKIVRLYPTATGRRNPYVSDVTILNIDIGLCYTVSIFLGDSPGISHYAVGCLVELQLTHESGGPKLSDFPPVYPICCNTASQRSTRLARKTLIIFIS